MSKNISLITILGGGSRGGSVVLLEHPFWQELFHFDGDFGENLEIPWVFALNCSKRPRPRSRNPASGPDTYTSMITVNPQRYERHLNYTKNTNAIIGQTTSTGGLRNTSLEPSLRLKIRVKKPIPTFQCLKKPMNRGSPRAIAHKSLTFNK